MKEPPRKLQKYERGWVFQFNYMEGQPQAKIEDSASELLLEFQRLFGLIDKEDNNDLSTVAERVKRLIYNHLVASGKLASEIDLEAWQQEIFPNTEHPRPTLLIEMAQEYDIINFENTSEILRQKLIQLLNDYRNRNRFTANQALIAEIEEAIAKDITPAEYNILASKLLSQVYK